MSAEILINVTPQESRVALLENGILQELFIERSSSQGIVGNIYKGKVLRVLPGMEAAFIDIGQEKAAFLHASDLRFPKEQLFNGDTPEEEISLPPISQLLHDGKYVLSPSHQRSDGYQRRAFDHARYHSVALRSADARYRYHRHL